jgi:hypothetical protein
MQLITKAILLLPLLVSSAYAADPLPDAIAAPGTTPVLTAHAQGEQIYECKGGPDHLVWTFREPAATLSADGKVAGKHYAGPSWELNDGSAIVGKAVGSAPGKTANDVAWLKLDVTTHRGSGALADVTTVQRINTVGGKLDGACERAGETRGVPYTADYVFLRKS